MINGEYTELKVWRRLAIRVLALLIFAAVFRAYFGFSNHEAYAVESWPGIFMAFIFGVRFDLSALMVFDSGLLLIWLWLLQWRAPSWVLRFWSWDYAIINIGLILASFVDLELFRVHGQRQSVLHVQVAAEYSRNPLGLLFSYGWQIFLFLIFGAVFIFVERHLSRQERFWISEQREVKRRSSLPMRWLQTFASSLAFITLAVLGVRGGIQGKPLGIAVAGDLGSDRLANLSLSAPYMMTHWEAAHVQADHFFADQQSLLKALEPEPLIAKNSGILKGQNVVLIVMESFGREYMGWKNPWKGYTPFLDSLAERAVGFPNAFANGKNSIEFPPAIMAGIPGWQEDPYIRSPYATNSLYTIEQLFRERGYRTAFFHGVGNGTMYFDSFMKLAGVESYYGLNEYPNPKPDFDGRWGIFDGPYFRYFLNHINQDAQTSSQPFFYTVFSVSSHHPYKLPVGLESKYSSGEHPMQNVVAYADDSLKEFFEQAEKQPWFKNTLFVITGDHTSITFKPEFMTPMGRFRVPIVFYHPRIALPPTDQSRLAQHLDIAPSLTDLFDLKTVHHSPFGRSLFRDNQPAIVNYKEGTFWIAEGSRVLVRSPGGQEQVFDYVKDPLMKAPLASDTIQVESQPEHPPTMAHLSERLKANIQMYHNGLIENSLFRWSTPLAASTSR